MAPKSEKIDKRQMPGYLFNTDLEELIKDGIEFFGETRAEQMLNQNDFTIIRGFVQRYAGQGPGTLTGHEFTTLKRCLENCVVFRPEGKEEE